MKHWLYTFIRTASGFLPGAFLLSLIQNLNYFSITFIQLLFFSGYYTLFDKSFNFIIKKIKKKYMEHLYDKN